MADPTLVNGQVTDAVTQSNVKILGDAPAESTGLVYQAMGHSMGLAMQNAVSQQQQGTTVNNTVTTQGVNLLMAMPPAATGRSSDHLLTGNAIAQQLLSQLTSIAGGKEAQQIVTTPPRPPGSGSP